MSDIAYRRWRLSYNPRLADFGHFNGARMFLLEHQRNKDDQHTGAHK